MLTVLIFDVETGRQKYLKPQLNGLKLGNLLLGGAKRSKEVQREKKREKRGKRVGLIDVPGLTFGFLLLLSLCFEGGVPILHMLHMRITEISNLLVQVKQSLPLIPPPLPSFPSFNLLTTKS